MSTINGTNGINALTGTAAGDAIRGYGGGDWLDGRAGNDFLYGGAGADVLTGGPGRDSLSGGTGNDWFRFTDARSIDTITDFVSGSDHIDLGFIISESQFHFIGAAPFSGQAGQGRYANGMFQLDINGDTSVDFAIACAGHMAAGDFDFIASGWWDYPTSV